MDLTCRHAGTAALETEHLLLRPYTMDDAEAMYRNWAAIIKASVMLCDTPYCVSIG